MGSSLGTQANSEIPVLRSTSEQRTRPGRGANPEIPAFEVNFRCNPEQRTRPAEIEGPVIGIDLGTIDSCIDIWQHGRLKIIPNDQGNNTIPSSVAFVESGSFHAAADKEEDGRCW